MKRSPMISNLSNMRRSLVFPDCPQVTWLSTQFIPSLWPLSGNMTLLSMYRQGGLTFCHYYSWAWSIPLLSRPSWDYFEYFLDGGRDMTVLSSPQQYKWDYRSGQIWEEFLQPHQFKFKRGVLCYVFCVEIVNSNRNLRARMQLLSDILVALFDCVSHSYWYCFLTTHQEITK